jgi:hypothetical protein
MKTASFMHSAVVRLSHDFGASLYLKIIRHKGQDYEVIDREALEGDDRIRPSYDFNDWTPGDYTFAEDTQALYLTGTGEMLWQAAHMRD